MPRDNFGRFQKQAMIQIKKNLKQISEEAKIDVQQIVADEMLRKYKDNVEASFSARSQRSKEIAEYNTYQEKLRAKDPERKRRHRKTPPYKHTGFLLEHIGVAIEDDRVKIVVDPVPYQEQSGRKKPVTAEDVHDFLRKGTKGGGNYLYTGRDGEKHWATNTPTSKHDFEIHTVEQMKGFLANLKLSDYKRKRRYKLK